MKRSTASSGAALGLAVLLAIAGPALAQQDTARAGMGRGMGQGHGMMGGQMGMGMMMRMGGMHGGMSGMMRGHLGPPVLLGLKEELGLSDEQVGRLEKIRDEHRKRVRDQMKKLQSERKALREARRKGDWDALEKGIDEASRLRAEMAKEMLGVERRSLGVLTDAQRQKVETWREGARLLGAQWMKHRRQMRGMMMRMRRGGTGGRGMHGPGMHGPGHGGPPSRP